MNKNYMLYISGVLSEAQYYSLIESDDKLQPSSSGKFMCSSCGVKFDRQKKDSEECPVCFDVSDEFRDNTKNLPKYTTDMSMDDYLRGSNK